MGRHRQPKARKKGKSPDYIEKEARGLKHVDMPWVDSLEELQALGSDANGAHITEDENGDLRLYFRCGLDYDMPIINDVLFNSPNKKPSWHATQKSKTTWDLFPSLHMVEVFHFMGSISNVPSPAPWLGYDGAEWKTMISEKGAVFIYKQIGRINQRTGEVHSW